jgi:phage repressor protein C with HTH and peptisase S24 domain
MLRHSDIWKALDRLALENGLTPSGLARRAGLDPTTFNPSKRVTRDGKLRWPSTESVSKVLDVTSCSLGHLVDLVDEPRSTLRALPVINLNTAERMACFDAKGMPRGTFWGSTPLPDFGYGDAYALQISGDRMMPVYRDGDTVVVALSAPIRIGDRIIAKLASGGVILRQVARQTPARLTLSPVGGEGAPQTIATGEIIWSARIIWASQ